MSVTKEKPKTELEVSLEPYFKEFEEKAIEWKEKAESLVVTDASDTDLMASAREARLALRQIRIGVNHKHAELKEEALKTGQTLDAIRRRLVGLIEPLESHLQEQEDFVAIKEREAKEQLTNERIALLEPYIGEQASLMSLGDMDEAVFNTVLEGQKAAQKQKEQEEADRAAAEAKAAEEARIEQERIRKENELLRKQNEAKEKKLRAEREAREKLEAEAMAKAEAEEAERKAQAAAQRKAKRAPDKQKLLSLAEQIELLNCEKLKDEDAQKILNNATDLLAKVVKYIRTNADKL